MPDSKILFLSHAAADQEIALYLKQILEQEIAGLDVFVSSDPEDLPPGDPWVKTVLSNLRSAFAIYALATERGLSRKWVWFETGAAWGRHDAFTPCCLGKIRKHELPAPHSQFQAVNLDDERDLHAVVTGLALRVCAPKPTTNYSTVVSELIRLDIRAEQRARIAAAVPFSAEVTAKIEAGIKRPRPFEQEAVRQLLIEGELTDQRVIALLRENGLLTENVGSVFYAISSNTGFVQRAWPPSDEERVHGYRGPWIINPRFKHDLELYFSHK